MHLRPFGKSGLTVSDVSFGAWAIGGSWGTVSDDESRAALHRAIDLGTNFVDTADVYGDGRSERLVASVLAERKERVFVATKAGRRLAPHTADGYSLENLRRFVDRSRENLRVASLDLLQLHCPPTTVYSNDGVFDALDTLVSEGRVQRYGVSVETCDEALTAITRHPNVASVQIILNALRLKPLERFLPEACARGVAVIARVPLASGLLTGKLSATSTFPPDDHRTFNRFGESFDVGETFSGVPLEFAFEAVEALRAAVPEGWTMARFALAWCLSQQGVSCVIPGAKNPQQVEDNVGASGLTLTDDQLALVRSVYERIVAPHVHHRW
jgi:aryl-alcohol dehydrogenase-like predicted oxidoreductase